MPSIAFFFEHTLYEISVFIIEFLRVIFENQQKSYSLLNSMVFSVFSIENLVINPINCSFSLPGAVSSLFFIRLFQNLIYDNLLLFRDHKSGPLVFLMFVAVGKLIHCN